jgi:hypothetical protein
MLVTWPSSLAKLAGQHSLTCVSTHTPSHATAAAAVVVAGALPCGATAAAAGGGVGLLIEYKQHISHVGPLLLLLLLLQACWLSTRICSTAMT